MSAIIRGGDPDAGEIVFSCHLCHQKPGANDNASGCAAILEDARILARLVREKALARPRRTIRFVFPPEIAGTMCYLARHPELVSRMKAAIHMDMVGGDPRSTKAILHLTRTPASLPSYVTDVAAAFFDYVVEGSRRAAMAGDFADANLSPEGSKELLIADIAPFSMGSDHDVYQEGSFRIPSIYLNDWPDVFIHTNNDTPANIDATKLQRVAVVGAASGYALANINSEAARWIAAETYARGAARMDAALRRALVVRNIGAAHSVAREAARWELAAMESIPDLAPALRESFQKRIRAREADAVAALTELRGEAESRPAGGPTPVRNPKVAGNLDVYYYDYIEDHAPGARPALTGMLAYEALNLVDGKRTVNEIRDILSAAYEPVPVDKVLEYMRLLEKLGVVRFGR